jgi:hypothetical protein
MVVVKWILGGLGQIASLVGDLFRWFVVWGAYRLGIRKERQQQVEKRLEQDNEAARIKRRVDTDAEYRKRLRDKYTQR